MRIFSPFDTSVWRDRYGTYSDGDIEIGSNTIYSGANAGIIGAYVVDNSSNPTITLDAPSTFQNGDLIVIHQTRGPILLTAPFANVRWEFNKVKAGGGTTSLQLEYPLDLPYQDSGAGDPNQAQVLEVNSYGNVITDATFTWGPAAWDGNKGGLFFFFAKSITNNGILELSSKGLRGGISEFTSRGTQGEGILGIGGYTTAANYDGGGGGQDVENMSGAGAGNKTTGVNGYSIGTVPQGGLAYGNDSLSLGGPAAGGGSTGVGGGHGGVGPSGGNGGAFGAFFSPHITGTGTIRSNGQDGTALFETASAPGAGGNILIAGEVLDLTGMTIQINAGASVAGTAHFSGQASQGRLRLNYFKQLTGSWSSLASVLKHEYYSNLYAHEGIFSSVSGALQQEKYKRMYRVEGL